MLAWPRIVSTARTAEKSAIALCETSMIRRRSTRSARMPPVSENTITGTTRVRPTSPSASGEPVKR